MPRKAEHSNQRNTGESGRGGDENRKITEVLEPQSTQRRTKVLRPVIQHPVILSEASRQRCAVEGSNATGLLSFLSAAKNPFDLHHSPPSPDLSSRASVLQHATRDKALAFR